MKVRRVARSVSEMGRGEVILKLVACVLGGMYCDS